MSGWYQRIIVPQIIRFGCGCTGLKQHRQRIVPKARGRVLEIGFGAGANLGFYDRDALTMLVGIEPSEPLRVMAATAAKEIGIAVDILDAPAERLPFADASFDTVVSTFTLCSVEDPIRCLMEARRVLKPEGCLLFCEHGEAPDPKIRTWQHRVDPLWKNLFGGCRISRPVRGNIGRVFRLEHWEGGYQGEKPSLAGWMEWGEARLE
jgi:ubiquinone/menaquinone biosynthesis C-methylase UbiE